MFTYRTLFLSLLLKKLVKVVGSHSSRKKGKKLRVLSETESCKCWKETKNSIPTIVYIDSFLLLSIYVPHLLCIQHIHVYLLPLVIFSQSFSISYRVQYCWNLKMWRQCDWTHRIIQILVNLSLSFGFFTNRKKIGEIFFHKEFGEWVSWTLCKLHLTLWIFWSLQVRNCNDFTDN